MPEPVGGELSSADEEQAAAQSAAALDKDSADKESEDYWYDHVYQGDHVPQLTLRAVLMGGFLGAIMTISNLYTIIKVGWAFGVAITACVLSFVIWRVVRFFFRNVSEMTILENNCMQSTASAAGYSTGATVGLAFGALLLITGKHEPWTVLLPWTAISATMGVLLAVPMKKQMINVEKLAFPSGIAAAQTLKSLHSKSKEAISQAYSLVATMAAGAIIGFLSKNELDWSHFPVKLKIPDLIPFKMQWRGINMEDTPGFGFEPSLMLIAAGMLVGLRVSTSMLFGALVLYFIAGPWALEQGQISRPGGLLKEWALWSGSAIMLTSGLTAFALEWKTIVRSLNVFKTTKSAEALSPAEAEKQAKRDAIEVPVKWLVIGIIPLAVCFIVLQWLAFSIAPHVGILTVTLSFFLALVACRSTGETDITPMSAMAKITQIAVAVVAPKAIVTNLMAASVTATTASSSADLLTDLKSGYLLGANPRRQFLAQLSGVFFGLTVVPAWYLMIPNKAALEAFNPPTVTIWKAVATALSEGIGTIPITARWGMVIGGVLGIALAILDKQAPKRWKPYVPSAMGLGLSWVMTFNNALAFFIGALIAHIWTTVSKKSGELYVVPVASGAIAGESLVCAIISIIGAAQGLMHH